MGNLQSLQQDIDEILNSTSSALESLKERKITVFGCTGFIGKWLVSTLISANKQLSLDIKLELVSSDISKARSLFSSLNDDRIDIINVKQFTETADYSDILFHGATPTTNSERSISLSNNAPVQIATEIVKIAQKNKNFPKVIHLNSGSVYGEQALTTKWQGETSETTDSPRDSYTKTKLEIDKIFINAEKEEVISYNSPRLYAFAGPYLPLNEHFAIGNFVSAAIQSKPIVLFGNSNTMRSYLYPSDLVHALIQICAVETKEIVNIGSDVPISMLELAEKVSGNIGRVPIILSGEEKSPSNYVPSIENLRKHVTHKPFIEIDEILARWYRWIKN